MKSDQRGLVTEEKEEETSCKITQLSEIFVDKVKSTTHFQHMESSSIAITGLHTTKPETIVVAERSKNGDGENLNKQRKEPEYYSSSSNPKANISLFGIRRRNSGRYAAEITDRIRHRRVWLSTFDTVEEASQTYLSKKTEFEKLSQGRNKEDRSKKNCDPRKTTHIIGVHKRKDSGKYVSEITNPISKKRIWLGTFGTAEEASRAYQSKKLEFQKLVHAKRQCSSYKQTHSTQDDKSGHENVNCELESAGGSEFDVPTPNSSNGGAEQRIDSHQIGIAEEPVAASLSVTSDQTLGTASLGSRRKKRNDSHRTTHIVGAHKRKMSGKYASAIRNPISKKRIWLGTFDTADEASRAYQSKKLEFQKLVKAKKQQCTSKQTHSKLDRKSEKLVNAKHEHENVNCELKSAGGSAEIDVPLSNSSNGGTVQRINSPEIGVAEEAFHAYLSKKFDSHSSKEVNMQSAMATNSSAGEKQEGQEDDEDLWMGEWVQLPGDDRAVMFSLKIGLPIIDNYGYLLGEFSTLDDLSIS